MWGRLRCREVFRCLPRQIEGYRTWGHEEEEGFNSWLLGALAANGEASGNDVLSGQKNLLTQEVSYLHIPWICR
ncbi:hypothetical protein RchiOBHm_Chr5g0046481 [Rosa chinensis]|uniref:Uncharacterized protein n=1 Tax=Rosa chinensis TaxID=74649 RepID=A0A2P6QE66_ROSCH|nr:hypothetical protein RchiOBHm_Chr5g0046481 [Rosa chinensis]